MLRLTRLCCTLLPVLALVACDRHENAVSPADPEEVGTLVGEGDDLVTDSGAELDRRLIELLEIRGDGRLDTFRMPRSDDFAHIPQDPRNPLSAAKVALGRRLFHETALGVGNVLPEGRETYSCASCHHAGAGFMANLPQGMAEGGSGFGARGEGRLFLAQYDSNPHAPDCQPIRSPTALNVAYQELMLWNGQFGAVGANLGTEDQWTEGTPLESNWLGLHGIETQAHAALGVHRMSAEESRAATNPRYREAFREAFPGDPDPVNRLNAALAIAAYERTLLASQSPFQQWLRGDRDEMSEREKRGALVFFGSGDCVSCHTGPALNAMEFHGLGLNDLDGAYDLARVNLAPFGGTIAEDVRRGRGGFTKRPGDEYRFKTPQLYNLIDSPFYGHGASFGSVRAVVEYKNAAVAENLLVPEDRLSERFVPLGLTDDEIDDLVTFLETGLYDAFLNRYVPHELPSGNCFPNNDPQSRADLGCGGGEMARR